VCEWLGFRVLEAAKSGVTRRAEKGSASRVQTKKVGEKKPRKKKKVGGQK
jgi:hypothetical protein